MTKLQKKIYKEMDKALYRFYANNLENVPELWLSRKWNNKISVTGGDIHGYSSAVAPICSVIIIDDLVGVQVYPEGTYRAIKCSNKNCKVGK